MVEYYRLLHNELYYIILRWHYALFHVVLGFNIVAYEDRKQVISHIVLELFRCISCECIVQYHLYRGEERLIECCRGVNLL